MTEDELLAVVYGESAIDKAENEQNRELEKAKREIKSLKAKLRES